MSCFKKTSGCVTKSGNSDSYYYYCQAPGDMPLSKQAMPETWLKHPQSILWFMTIIPGIASVIVIMCALVVLGIAGWMLVKYIRLLRLRSSHLKDLQKRKQLLNEKAMRINSLGEDTDAIRTTSAEMQTDMFKDIMVGTGEHNYTGSAISEDRDPEALDALDNVEEDDDEGDIDILTGRKRKKNLHQHQHHHHHHHHHHQHEHELKKAGVANILHRVREGVLGKQQHHRNSGSKQYEEEKGSQQEKEMPHL